jgi:hypothetical protein
MFFQIQNFLKFFSAFCLIIGLTLSPANADNLSTCLTGKYPSLCNKSLLTDSQRQQADAAERSENLKTCLTGKYPSLCKRNLLTQEQTSQVRYAENRENLATCLTGRYTSLCNHATLSSDELTRVRAAERRENLSVCMTGRYPSLCNKSILTTDELKATETAEKRVRSEPPAPRPSYAGRRGGCEAGHWVDSVSSNGELVKLEDGSLWQIDLVDQIDTALWLPTTDIVVCPYKLINTEDNESVSAIRLR